MYPHQIRLRGPWEAVVGGRSPIRIQLPAEWDQLTLLPGNEEVNLMRHFGRPRLFDEDEKVFLICRYPGTVAAELNGHILRIANRFQHSTEWTVTEQLKPRNVLTVALKVANLDRPPEVTLEIRGPVYLQDVTFGHNNISGKVMGQFRQNLELHLLRNGRLETTISGQANQEFAFQLTQEVDADSDDWNNHTWSVELVEAANCWFKVEVPSQAKSQSG